MLASTYLTARKLGLTAKERQALIEVLEGLERGWFVHAQLYEDLGYDVGLAFNMADFNCGTTACIAGWCDVLYKTQFVDEGWIERRGRRKNLQDLFHAHGDDGWLWVELDDITPRQAAMALRNYLTTGKPYWDEVMKGSQEKAHGALVEEQHGQTDDQGEEGVTELELCPAGQG